MQDLVQTENKSKGYYCQNINISNGWHDPGKCRFDIASSIAWVQVERFNAEVCLETDQTIFVKHRKWAKGNDHLNANIDRTRNIHFHTEIPSEFVKKQRLATMKCSIL